MEEQGKLINIYQKLYNAFGSQYWWPAFTEVTADRPAFGKITTDKLALKKQQKFEICLGAILTQNTNWQNVEKAVYNLHKNKLLSPQKILQATSYKLQTKIKSTGYYKQKTKKLKIFSQMLLNEFKGDIDQLFKLPLEQARHKLLTTWGIGPETADSMLLYAGAKPIFVIDAYTKRLAKCLGLKNFDYHSLQRYFTQNLPKSVKIYQEFHALIVKLAKENCRAKPRCKSCPVKDLICF